MRVCVCTVGSEAQPKWLLETVCEWKSSNKCVCAPLNLKYKLQPEAVNQTRFSLNSCFETETIPPKNTWMCDVKLNLIWSDIFFPRTPSSHISCQTEVWLSSNTGVCVCECVCLHLSDRAWWAVQNSRHRCRECVVKMEDCLRLYWKWIFNTHWSQESDLLPSISSSFSSCRSSSVHLFLLPLSRSFIVFPSCHFSSLHHPPLPTHASILSFSSSSFSLLSPWWLSVWGVRKSCPIYHPPFFHNKAADGLGNNSLCSFTAANVVRLKQDC